jgi:hypothetical protein
MHNGVFKSLKEVVHFYNTRDVEDWPEPEVAVNVNSDELGDLGLTKKEEVDIVAFMMTLNDGYMEGGGGGRSLDLARPVVAPDLSPNPFHGQTTVSWTVPASGRVRVDVFDVTGRRVATLVDGVQARGVQSARLEGVPAGVYFVRMDTGGKVSTAKAISLR